MSTMQRIQYHSYGGPELMRLVPRMPGGADEIRLERVAVA